MEIWKNIDIDNFRFKVSNLGNVYLEPSLFISNQKKFYKNPIKLNSDLVRYDTNGYEFVMVGKTRIQVHKLIAMAFLGYEPPKRKNTIVIDHIDHNPKNNRVDNLQITTQRHNCSKDKFRKNPKSKYTGVSWNKPMQKWGSKIYIDGKNKHLGYFKNELDAHKAYQKALKELRF